MKHSLCDFRLLIFLVAIVFAAQQAGAQAKAPAPQAAAALSLGDYLTQVSDKHLGIKAADQTAKAAKEESGEGGLLFKPTLVGQASDTADARNNPFGSDPVIKTQTYNLGIAEQTDFGLQGKLSYNYLNFDVPGLGDYGTAYPQIELTQSLLRNWGGAEARSQAKLIETGDLAKSFSQSYVTKSLLLEAESAYWRLALAREIVQMQKDAVERAQKIYDWTARRVRLQLADRAEGLQASTNLQARKVDLRSALDDERVAAQAFNSSRGVLSEVVPEQLANLGPDLVSTMTVPARTVTRDDVKAAEYQSQSSAASALLAREKDKPTLELFGQTILNDPTPPPAQYALALPLNARPGTVVGLRLSAPLDFATVSKARQGYAAEAQAADWSFQRKKFEEERDWQDLTAKFRESKERLKLYVDLERQQKEKLDYERDRQQHGRSTLQQVLLYETDYELAQQGRIRTLADLLTLNAQMKLYGVSYESR